MLLLLYSCCCSCSYCYALYYTVLRCAMPSYALLVHGQRLSPTRLNADVVLMHIPADSTAIALASAIISLVLASANAIRCFAMTCYVMHTSASRGM